MPKKWAGLMVPQWWMGFTNSPELNEVVRGAIFLHRKERFFDAFKQELSLTKLGDMAGMDKGTLSRMSNDKVAVKQDLLMEYSLLWTVNRAQSRQVEITDLRPLTFDLVVRVTDYVLEVFGKGKHPADDCRAYAAYMLAAPQTYDGGKTTFVFADTAANRLKLDVAGLQAAAKVVPLPTAQLESRILQTAERLQPIVSRW